MYSFFRWKVFLCSISKFVTVTKPPPVIKRFVRMQPSSFLRIVVIVRKMQSFYFLMDFCKIQITWIGERIGIDKYLKLKLI